MIHSPTAHARAVLAGLTEKLALARNDELLGADRIAALDMELALCAARLADMPAPQEEVATAHRRAVLNQRLSNLGDLRASLVAERARRRRSIDELSQRKEAIEAALACLREQALSRIASAR